MSVSFTQLRQTIDLAEKVKVDSGEKIVKTEKVGRKKNIEVTVTTKGGKFFVYFDSEKYAGSYRNEKDADKIVKDYLKLVGEELTEVRGKVGSSDGDEEADKNIMMQLRKVVSLRGMKPVTFNDNKKAKVNPKDAEKLLSIYDRLKPASKMQLQTVLAKSKKDFDNAVKQLAKFEEVDLEEGALSDKWRKGARSIKVGKFELVRGKSGVHKILKDRKPFGDLSLDDEAGMWVGNMKGMKGQWVGREVDDLFKHLKKAHNEEVELEEAGLPPHLAKLFDKDGNFKDPKKQKIFNRMMGDGIGKEIAQKMGRIKFRVDADSAKKKVKVYVDSNDEKDAQRALKNHPAYISGAMRVIPEELEEGTWALPDTSQKKQGLKKAMSKPIKLGKGGDDAISVVGAFIGDDELYDDLGVAGDKNPNGDARPIVSKWMKKNFKGSWSKYAIEEVELEEKYTAKQYKMAFGVLNDPRWKGGNMTRIVNTIEKIAKGLSKDKAVAKAIQLTNESLEERELTPAELKKREKIAKDLPDDDFKKRYGDDWMSVKMGTATNMAKGES